MQTWGRKSAEPTTRAGIASLALLLGSVLTFALPGFVIAALGLSAAGAVIGTLGAMATPRGESEKAYLALAGAIAGGVAFTYYFFS